MKSSFFAAALLALTVGCFNQEPGNVEVILDEKISGEEGKDIKFAIFGVAESEGQTSMIIIASNQEDLCDELGNNPAAFVDDILAGEEPGEFVLTTVLVDGAPGNNVRFDGDKQNDQVVDPKFLVGNGAKLEAGAEDKDAEATLEIDTFDGQTLVGRVEANLNEDLNAVLGGLIGGDLNVPMTVEIFTSTECAALSTLAQAQF